MIKLITVIGHGIELLPHFIQHYRQDVDEINIVVYSSEKYPDIEDDVTNIVKKYDNVKIIHSEKWREYDWEHVTFLYNYFKRQYPEDWWVIADIDEFQIYSKPIREIVKDCEENGWGFVTGGFIDRVGHDGEFPEIYDEASIWKQFPMAGFFRHPISNACPNKVTLCKGNIEVSNGQHYAIIGGETTWKWRGWNHPLRYPVDKNFTQVHHFKWDSTVKRRIKAVADVNKDYAYSDEYRIMYEYLRKNRYMIDISNQEFMFEYQPILPDYYFYSKWNKLKNKILSI